MTKVLNVFLASACIVLFGTLQAFSEEVKKIEDNSFLLEEAYNQEDGVIQHISAYQYIKKTKTWGFTFTQEWPVPKQAHQLSYTIPVLHFGEDGSQTGMGDIALNYRYQLIRKDGLAVSPRFSMLFPTGDYKRGMGTDATGYQVNLPISVELGDRWVTHWNAGMTFIPDAKAVTGEEGDIAGYNAGASLILLASETFNLMTEAAWNSMQSVNADGSRSREETFFINPGVRGAINYKSGLQVVPGLAFPVGIGASHGEYGVFLYLSFEHPLF